MVVIIVVVIALAVVVSSKLVQSAPQGCSQFSLHLLCGLNWKLRTYGKFTNVVRDS